MKKIHNAEELKIRIRELESQRIVDEQAMKSQFHETYEQFKPANILKNTVKEVTSSPAIRNNLLNLALGIGTGFLSKKLIVGKKSGLLKKTLGTVLQFGVTSLVSRSKENEEETDHKKGNLLKRIFSGNNKEKTER